LYVTYLSVVYFVFFFFFNDPATTEIYTLSLHDALPISTTRRNPLTQRDFMFPFAQTKPSTAALPDPSPLALSCSLAGAPLCLPRSEEHTSELQSRGHLVCRLLLEKKKKY